MRGHYTSPSLSRPACNDHGATPATLLACNDDLLFPEFRGRDLSTWFGRTVAVVERAVDGSTVGDVPRQLAIAPVPAGAIMLLTIGGNDLLEGLVLGDNPAFAAFQRTLRRILDAVKHARLFVGNVYDPSFSNDARNFLSIDPSIARRAHRRVNETLAAETAELTARSSTCMPIS